MISIGLIFTFFTGCQSALSVFDKTGTQYEKGLQHTKVKHVTFENQTKAIINVTYLNSMDSKKWDNKYQNFLVGIYISDDFKDEDKRALNNKSFKLSMNDKKSVKSTLFTNKYKLYKHIPLKNPWATYYIISFKKDDKKSSNIKYYHSKYGSVILPFQTE